jgi:hypothetical protein
LKDAINNTTSRTAGGRTFTPEIHEQLFREH